MTYRSIYLKLVAGSRSEETDCLVPCVSPRWLEKSYFELQFERAYETGARNLCLDYTPALDEAVGNDLMAGQVVSQAFRFLAEHSDCTISLLGTDAYSKWARRLDSEPDLATWAQVVEQARLLMTYDPYEQAHRAELARASARLTKLEPALVWRVTLEHLEHFLLGTVEFAHDCSFSTPYRQIVTDQLLAFYSGVGDLPNWRPILEEIERPEVLGEGNIFVVPALGELVKGIQVAGSVGLVALVCGCEAVAKRVGPVPPLLSEKARQRCETGVLVAGGLAAAPLVLGYSAAKGLSKAIGRGYVRWKRARGERIPLRRYSPTRHM